MYYPYLRARQFELITLRELVAEGALENRVTPILEPVKATFNNLDLAFAAFLEKNQKAFIIVNPNVGELNSSEGPHLIADYILEKNLKGDILLPAFHYFDKTDLAEEILALLHEKGLANCLLICKNDINYDDASFDALIADARISMFAVEDPGRSRGLKRKLDRVNKPILRLDDLFEAQERNSDFLDIEEHRFSEEHLYYKTEGFIGFSDYTTLPSSFSDGGSTPRAVVIHLTFRKTNDEFWIRHFTSDTNDSIANVQGKFAEAALKAVTFCRANGFVNSAITELQGYFDNQHYPGLGVVKKIAIKNHILLVSEYLRDNPY